VNKKDELEGRLSQLASHLTTWRSFVEHPGWKLFEQIAKEQRFGRLLVLAEPCEGMGVVLKQEFMKGEASGIYLMMKMPENQLEMLKIEMAALETAVQLEETHERQMEVSASEPGRVDDVNWWGGEPLASTGSRFRAE
jgi:hypothetical protein